MLGSGIAQARYLVENNAKITIFMLLIWATAYIHPMCSSTRSYLKNLENPRENSGEFELLWKKPGKLRENERYVT